MGVRAVMYAVIRTGAKQYRVSPGDVITVEKLERQIGEELEFDDVLLFHDGNRVVTKSEDLDKVRVKGEVVEQGKGKKIIVFKYRPKKGYRRKKGHRQPLTKVKIKDIIFSS